MKHRPWLPFVLAGLVIAILDAVVLLLLPEEQLAADLPTDKAFTIQTTAPPPSATDPINKGRRGFISRVYVDEHGAEHRYVVFVPHRVQEGVKPPVLMFLNGSGENGRDGLDQVKPVLGPAVWEMQRDFPFVVVFPQGRSGWHPEGPDAKRALAIMDEVAQTYGTDPDRVYLTGVCSGGIGTWRIAAEFPKRFAAIVPLCGGAGDYSIAGRLAEANLPIWSFSNSNDKPYIVKYNRQIRTELIKAGASPLFTEISAAGHDCWNFAYRVPALYSWMLEQSRSKNAKQKGVFTPLSDGQSLNGWKPFGAGDDRWLVDQDGFISCDNRADEGDAFLICEVPYDDFDFHFDFYSPSGADCHVFFRCRPGNGTLNGWKAVASHPDHASGGIFTTDGLDWLQAADPVAQQTYRTDRWNDYRIHVVGGHVTTYLNGWKINDYREDELDGSHGDIALQVPSGENGNVRWRHLRIREIHESDTQEESVEISSVERNR